MSVTAPTSTHTGLLAELEELADRLPVPQPSWHPHVALISTCRDDLTWAIDAVAGNEPALDLVLAALAGDAPVPGFAPDASPELVGAWQRLQALPLPEGRHPYLDEIRPAFEALRLLLVALSRTGS